MAGVKRSLRGGIAQLMPRSGFTFSRPLVLLQSDDWGRVGVRDNQGLERLRAAGLDLGQTPYDLYSMETWEDVAALLTCLRRHKDATGRSPCIQMNFVLANVDFEKTAGAQFRRIELLPLHRGLPGKWWRPRVMTAIHAGIGAGLIAPALHGLTHFCLPAVAAGLARDGERAELLRTLWKAQTPYIHCRMPWIGYEYWDPEQPPKKRFLSAKLQREAVSEAAAVFQECFRQPPVSACAPGYRANADTERAWAEAGVKVAQNGPEQILPVHFSARKLLQTYRAVEFEPATDPQFSLPRALRAADRCIERGWPVVTSVHAINFQSSLRDFRSCTLRHLDAFLTALKRNYPDLLFAHDADLMDLVESGEYEHAGGKVKVRVRKKRFWRRGVAQPQAE
jgi:hypothetical protein